MIVLRPAPISTNHIYKMRSKPFPKMYMTPEGRNLKIEWHFQARAQYQIPELGPVKLRVRIFYGDHRARDIDNGNKLLFDALSGALYRDDSQIEELTTIKSYDKADPRVEIELV